MKSSLLSIVVIVGMLSCDHSKSNNSRVSKLPFYNDPSFTPYWFTTYSDSLDSFHRISSFRFLNQEGKTITQAFFQDKIYVANFFFTSCPGICPKMTDNMMRLQEEFLDDNEVLLLSHSVTPTYDSVSVLKKYAERKGILSSKWHLLTGDQKEIYKLGREDYFIEEDLGLNKSQFDFLHTENLVLIDKNRHIRGIYNGLSKTSLRHLITDIHTLKLED